MINNRPLIKLISKSHVFWYRLTGGAVGGKVANVPILLLTTIGRKTGKARTTPLLYQADGNRYVVVASNAGDDNTPFWWLNLQSNPRGEIQVGRDKKMIRAVKASPEEKKRLWQVMAKAYPSYDEYQTRTQREIDVVVLEPDGA
jgi:deazaflavin-dependent oxidoreductase (nitroreductase family)